jgi:hypothetical protein
MVATVPPVKANYEADGNLLPFALEEVFVFRET